MKTKLKRTSKSALSVILALMMVVSTMLVGVISVDAAISKWYIVGSQQNNSNMSWTVNDSHAINGSSGSYTVNTNGNTNPIYFKLVALENSQKFLCTTSSSSNVQLTYNVKSDSLEWYKGPDNNLYTSWTNFEYANNQNGYNAQLVYTPAANTTTVTFTVTNDNGNCVTVTDNRSIDPDYYIEGRFRIKNADGTEKGFDWQSESTDIHFDSNTGTDGLYKLETNCTLNELSANYSSNNPQYFYVWDKTTKTYYSADNDNLENYSSSANAVTLNSCTFNNNSNWMRFNSSSTSTAKVTLWLDTRNDQKKLYYTTDATPVESDDYTLYDYSSNSEISLGKFSKNADDTYSLTLDLSAKQYKLFVRDKYNQNYFNQAKQFNNGSITLYDYDKDNTEHTISFTPSPAGTYKFTLTPGTSGNQKTATLSVERISALKSLYISGNLNDSSVTWNEITNKESVYSKSVTNGYTFAFSDKAEYNPDFAIDFSVAEDKTVFCSVTKGTKVIDSETGDSVTTYTVNTNTGCTSPTLYVDPATSTVYAIAKYDKTSEDNSEETIESKKKVTYYFAVRSDDDGDDGLNDGIRIKYWNNSLAANNWTEGSVGTINATTAVKNGTANNTIYINGSELFDSGFSNTKEPFKIYSADLPVWATSFAFTDLNNNPISVRSTLENYNATNDASLVLNPNRVYLYYSLESGQNYAKGVVLDDSLWTDNGTNAVSTKTFKANAVNFDTTYKSSNTKGEIANSFNQNKLTPVYPTNYAHPLYFGYIGKNWDTSYLNNSNFKIWDNLAMRNSDENDGRYYYASVQGLAGNKLSSSKNSNGYGLLYGYDNQTLMPLFDYSKLVKNGLAAEGNVHQGLNFPFN
ncbi:MAG: hypothetical protein ACI4HN_06550 [Ruminococcus sp.]